MRCVAEEIPVPPQVLGSEGGESRPPPASGPVAEVPPAVAAAPVPATTAPQSAGELRTPREGASAQTGGTPIATMDTPAPPPALPAATVETPVPPAETLSAGGETPAPVSVTPTVEARMRVAAVLLGRAPVSIEEADRVLSQQGFGHSPPGTH